MLQPCLQGSVLTCRTCGLPSQFPSSTWSRGTKYGYYEDEDDYEDHGGLVIANHASFHLHLHLHQICTDVRMYPVFVSIRISPTMASPSRCHSGSPRPSLIASMLLQMDVHLVMDETVLLFLFPLDHLASGMARALILALTLTLALADTTHPSPRPQGLIPTFFQSCRAESPSMGTWEEVRAEGGLQSPFAFLPG